MGIHHNLILKSCLLIFGIIFSVFLTTLKTNTVLAVADCEQQWPGPRMYVDITDYGTGQNYGSFSGYDNDVDGETLVTGNISVPYGVILRFQYTITAPFNYGNGIQTANGYVPYNSPYSNSATSTALSGSVLSESPMNQGDSYYSLIASSGCDNGAFFSSSTGDMYISINVQSPPTPTPITGCMDPNANNYNASATVAGSCSYDGDIYVVSVDSLGNPISSPWWAITGPGNYNGSGTSGSYLNAPTGTYSISAGGISGYSGPTVKTPPGTPQGLNANSSITFSLVYTPNSAPPPPPPPPPPASQPPGPFTLSVTPCSVVNNSNTVSLSWTTSANNPNYEIYEKQGTGSWSANPIATTTGTSYNVTGRPYNIDLYYYVRAVNSQGSIDSSPSGGIYGGNCPSIPPPPGACTIDTFTADNVSNLSLSYPNSGATLRWNTTDANTLTGSNAWSGNKAIRTGSESTGALAVGTYTYVLSCTASGGNDSKSVTINVASPPPPQGNNKVSVLTSCENISIAWNFGDSPVAPGYYIDISTNSQFNGRWTKHIPNPANPGFDNFNGTSEATNVANGWYNNPDSPASRESGMPILTPGQTYYARVWSNFQFYPKPNEYISFSVSACPTPTPKPSQPVWSGQPACVVPTGIYNANITWTGVHNTTNETISGGFGTYIDIDIDPYWNDAGLYDWWNRNISKNDNTRTVNTGGGSFKGFWPDQDNILSGLHPGTSYYARAYNGYPEWGVHSDTSAELNVPACTLTGTLTARPTFGVGPLSVTLTATRTGGTTSGLITYEFDCRNDDTYTGTVGPTSNTSATFVCTYPSRDTAYSAKATIFQSDELGQSMSYVPDPVSITASFGCPDLSQSCTSSPNVCGQTNQGTQTRTCDVNTGDVSDWGTCSAVPPPNSSCPAPVPSISCTPGTVGYGGSSTVAWSCTNSTYSVVSPNNWIGTCEEDGTCSGSRSTGALTSNKTYTVTCTGYNGSTNQTASCGVTISTPSVTISANPTSVNYNGSTTISWTPANASSCTASGGSSGWAGSRDSSNGTHPWTSGALTSDQTYTITCSGANGASASASVTVPVNPPTVTISGNQTLPWNSSPTITWTPANSGSCTATGGTTGWPGSRDASTGTHSWTSPSPITVPGVYVYSIQCFGDGETEVKNSFVTISNPIPSVGPGDPTYSPPDYCQSGPGGFVAWAYTDPSGSPQSAYEVQITDIGNFNNPLYDSGQLDSSSKVFSIPSGVLQFNKGYKARVRVWNDYGSVSAWSNPTSTFNTPNYAYPNVIPPYQFTWPTPPKPQLNKPVQFTDHTVFGGGNENNRQWSWSFGDGATSTQQSPVHTYTATGNYTVTEIVTDAANQTCGYSQFIEVIKPVPVIKEVAPR